MTTPDGGGPRSPTMRWIVGTSLRFRILAVALAAGLLALGFVQIRKMPVDRQWSGRLCTTSSVTPR